MDASTGLFIYSHEDLAIKDVIPFALERTYRQGDHLSRAFGIGTSHGGDIFLTGDVFSYAYQDLITAEGSRIHFTRTSPGTSYMDAVYVSHTNATDFYYGAQIAWKDYGWSLSLRNGTTLEFPESFLQTNPGLAAVTRMQDRYGNTVSFTRDSTTGNLTKVTTPNGRFISFIYDAGNRVVQAQDNIGRATAYSYDEGGRLIQSTDPAGGVTKYAYDANDQMTSITDARGNLVVTNTYDDNGRVSTQQHVDGGLYQFAYTEDVNGNILQTAVTDPRNTVETLAFQVSGYFTGGDIAAETVASNTPLAQTTSYSWDPATNLLQSTTDALGRQTTYTYDSLGNQTSVTYLAGTPQARSVEDALPFPSVPVGVLFRIASSSPFGGP